MRVPQPPPEPTPALLAEMFRLERFPRAPDIDGWYYHWDTFRHLPSEAGMTPELRWAGMQGGRRSLARELPLTDRDGKPFTVGFPDAAQRMLHDADLRLGGSIGSGERLPGQADRARYLVASFAEEAISTSILEGAATTRRAAKELLRTGRRPLNVAERMVVNAQRGLEIVAGWPDRQLRPQDVLELHRALVEGTTNEADAGRVQRPGEKRVVVAATDGTVVHEPPPAAELPARLERLCAFANAGAEDKPFVHPVARAILLHFGLAYDHPFVDGNGRVARALFSWSMLRSGYWMTEFVSISRLLLAAPARYGRSFLYTETDSGDTTYFLLSQLAILRRATDDLHAYVERRQLDVDAVERAIGPGSGLNHRQRALLSHAVRHPASRYTFEGHSRAHDVVYQSGRTDLLDLEGRGFLQRDKVGRRFEFLPAPDLGTRLER